MELGKNNKAFLILAHQVINKKNELAHPVFANSLHHLLDATKQEKKKRFKIKTGIQQVLNCVLRGWFGGGDHTRVSMTLSVTHSTS